MFSDIKCQGSVHSHFVEELALRIGNSECGGTKCKEFTCSSQYLLYALRKAHFLILSINVISQGGLSSSHRACPRCVT